MDLDFDGAELQRMLTLERLNVGGRRVAESASMSSDATRESAQQHEKKYVSVLRIQSPLGHSHV